MLNCRTSFLFALSGTVALLGPLQVTRVHAEGPTPDNIAAESRATPPPPAEPNTDTSLASGPHASNAPSGDSHTADALFRNGLIAMKAGDFKNACPQIEKSHALSPTPGSLFTLAECLSHLGSKSSAITHYREFLRQFSAFPLDRRQRYERHAIASEASITQLLPLVAQLNLQLPDDSPPDALVFLDGELVPPGSLGAPLLVDPGPHIVEMRSQGTTATSQSLKLGAGQHHLVQLRGLSPTAAPTPLKTSTANPYVERDLTWVYVTGGLGAVGLATGALTGLFVLQEKSVIDDACHPDESRVGGAIRCDPNSGAIDAANRADTLGAISTVSLGIGLVGAATAAVLYFSGRPRSGPDNSGISASLQAGPRSARAGLQTRW